MSGRRSSSGVAGVIGGVAAIIGVGAVGYGIVSSRREREHALAPPSPQIPPQTPPPNQPSTATASASHPARANASAQASTPTTSAPMTTQPKNYNAAYTVPFWCLVLVGYAANAGIPLEFIASSLAEESGGNPCAIGNPEQYGPDGNPREMGTLQLYNPDDLKIVGRTGASMRAYCNPNKVTYTSRDGKRTFLGPSQEVIRLLTAEEIEAEAKSIIAKISEMRSKVAHYVTENHITWPTSGKDFWRLVKLWHGLPGLVSTGLHAVTQHLGRPPTSWAEYRNLIQSGTVHCDAGTEAYRGADGFAHVFDNAEHATATMPGQVIV